MKETHDEGETSKAPVGQADTTRGGTITMTASQPFTHSGVRVEGQEAIDPNNPAKDARGMISANPLIQSGTQIVTDEATARHLEEQGLATRVGGRPAGEAGQEPSKEAHKASQDAKEAAAKSSAKR